LYDDWDELVADRNALRTQLADADNAIAYLKSRAEELLAQLAEAQSRLAIYSALTPKEQP